MKKILLKGGSLSETCLVKSEDRSFVRKSIHLYENVEYGYQRWYSQLKRLQRYNTLFPNYFPKIIDFGRESENYAFFDMEYVENSHNLLEWIISDQCEKRDINLVQDKMFELFDSMHKTHYDSSHNSVSLYIFQEVERSLNDCTNKEFVDFSDNQIIFYNGEEILSFKHLIHEYSNLFLKLYDSKVECFSHGNSTLENMLWVPEKEQLLFIDPYEENVIDSHLADYSQVLQSCNSKYELLNDCEETIVGNIVIAENIFSENLDLFNKKFIEKIQLRLSEQEYLVVKLLEISQFIRMLPFKQEKSLDKMKLFYTIASKLFHDMRKLT